MTLHKQSQRRIFSQLIIIIQRSTKDISILVSSLCSEECRWMTSRSKMYLFIHSTNPNTDFGNFFLKVQSFFSVVVERHSSKRTRVKDTHLVPDISGKYLHFFAIYFYIFNFRDNIMSKFKFFDCIRDLRPKLSPRD